jgi:hypothetical protein
MIHNCNPSYMGGRGRRIAVRGWPRQKHENLPEKEIKVTQEEGRAGMDGSIGSVCLTRAKL